MPEKDFEEIEIEQIDLDVDKSYDVTIDISSIDTSLEISEKEKIDTDFDLSLNNVVAQSEVNESEVSGEGIVSSEIGEDVENMISISDSELDEIISGANLEEEVGSSELESVFEGESQEESGKDIFAQLDEITSHDIGSFQSVGVEGVVSEDIFSSASEAISVEEEMGLGTGEVVSSVGVEGVVSEDVFSSASEAISVEKEVGLGVSESVISKGMEAGESLELEGGEEAAEVVVISADEYNKIVEESSQVSIVDKPIEEFLQVEEETYEEKETITPEEVGMKESLVDEFEIKEFQEISEEVVLDEKLLKDKEEVYVSEEMGMEGTKVLEEEFSEESLAVGDLTGEEMAEVGSETLFLEEEKKYEMVDDITLELETSTRESFSIMPDEVGIEEIMIEQKPSEGSEEILGIGFGEEVDKGVKELVEEETSEIVSEGFEERFSVSEPVEVGEVSLSEVVAEEGIETGVLEEEISFEEKTTKIEKAIEGLSEEEKEDIRKVLLYLDKLLENLPEDKIKEFASSEYYDIYVKLFDKLSLR